MGAFSYSAVAVDQARAARAASDFVRARCLATRAAAHSVVFRSRIARGAAALSGTSDSDTPVLLAAIAGASLCDPCIARKTGLAQSDVTATLARLDKTLVITTELGRCDGCLGADLVSRLG
jgi:hypothetical protein